MDQLARRSFIRDLGRGSLGIVVLGSVASACSGTQLSSKDAASPALPAPTDPTDAAAKRNYDVVRAELGGVSAWILVRGGQAAIVDTGNPNAEADILASLETVGLSYDDVSDVIVTHRHGDHAGSVPAVLEAAASAAVWAGAADLSSIRSPREVSAVGDGDQVFGLSIIETPGHTPGHISVLDPGGQFLVTGDALNGADGGVIGPNERFTPDMEEAFRSVDKLATFDFDQALFGHGDPLLFGADVAVRELAANR